jgi:hypothetical protein
MTDRSLINDPSDFVPRTTQASKWAKWFEGGEPIPSLVSECISLEVKETATVRARRIWRMPAQEEPDHVH